MTAKDVGEGRGGFRKERGWSSGLEVSLWRGTSHNRSTPEVCEHHAWKLFFFTAEMVFESQQGPGERRERAGNRLSSAMLKGSNFVFPVEIQKFGSDVSRLLGWIERKNSFSCT